MDFFYPKPFKVYRGNLNPAMCAQRIYQRELREAAKEVDLQCGGLKHIELAENDVRTS